MGRDPLSVRAGGGGSEADDVAERRLGRVVAEEIRVAETAVPLATLGVEDPELRPSPRRPVAAAGHERLGPLADDVPPEPDPCPPRQLQPQAGRFGDGGREPGGQPGWLEGDEERFRPPSEPGQPTQPLGDLGRGRAGVRARREIDHEDVDRATGEEHPGDRQALIEGVGGQDDEPVEPDAAGGGLDRIERLGEVQPGDDRAVRLGLGHEPEGNGRGTGARGTAQRDAGAPREPARPDDRIEGREAGPDDPLDAGPRVARRSRDVIGSVVAVGRLGRERRGGQRSHDPRSCRAPSRLEGRQSSRHVRGEAGHRTPRLEQVFDIVNGISAEPSVEVGPVGAHSADIPRRLIRRQIPSTLADIHAFARSIWLVRPVSVPPHAFST
jgi:hypothetical protein